MFINTEWLLSSLSCPMGGLINLDSIPLECLLNRSVSRPGVPRLTDVNLKSSDRMLMYLSSSAAILISTGVMQSVMSMHDSIVLMVMHMPWNFHSFYQLCLDS